jgi:uncharacterized membrane protein
VKIRWIQVLILAFLIIGINQEIASIDASPQYFLAQTADLQFTADSVSVSVEQGGSNTAIIQVHNFGGSTGSANITFAGTEPDGIAVELSVTSIVDLSGGSHQNITATISATADLWPLGPRRLDLSLNNGTMEFDSMYLEMNVIAPTTTNTSPFGLLGIPIETIILSLIVTMAVVIVVLKLRRR